MQNGRKWGGAGLIALLLMLCGVRAKAAFLVNETALTDRILMVQVRSGHLQHHGRGEPRSQESLGDLIPAVDFDAIRDRASYTIKSSDDRAFGTQKPIAVWCKRKGTDFAWFVDKWENNRAVNTRPDHISDYWIYLVLPSPMLPGKIYDIEYKPPFYSGKLPFSFHRPILFNNHFLRPSEAIHINLLGYAVFAPKKYAYVYHWMGDGGALDLSAYQGRPFHLIRPGGREPVFTGKLTFRKSKTNPETGQKTDTPNANFLGADVYECDFSAFNTPGEYYLHVEGIGFSEKLKIEPDAYRPAFQAVARALYHNRSGIALKMPFTEFERPAPHNPKLTPGFADKLRYTKVRWQEWGSEGGDAKKLMAKSPGILTDTWGWYQDAGDWDSYETHLRVAQELLLVYEMKPKNFADGELNIPESGNGVPDIVDEAAWLPRFCRRLRQELKVKGWGTGGIGLRVSGDAFGSDEGTKPDGSKFGRGSWEDTDRVWMVSGEDPWATYRYAGVAAHLALAYQVAGVKRDPDGVDWAKEARECYEWAKANTRAGDEAKENHSLKTHRAYAAACLFRLTGDKQYQTQFLKDTQGIMADTVLHDEARYAPFAYAVGNAKNPRDPQTLERIRAAIFHTADETVVTTAGKRALRWGGDWYFPMLVGQQTTPLILEGAVAYTLAKTAEPERAQKYLAGLYTTCDYFLGTNALNQTWTTGIGPRFPTQIFHMDAWYNSKGKFHPGLIPYGPWRKEKEVGQGPWDSDWANPTAYPAIDQFPGGERWFSNRCSPLSSEFTIHQNIAPAAAIYGFLCGDKIP